LFEISAPRNGIKHSFVTGRNDMIAQQIFWAVIRSQDIMSRFKDKAFKNDPTVSSEYVKFLIMNSGMDIVDKLLMKVAALEEKVATMIKDVKVAEAKSSTASNNVSTLTKTVEGLSKRLSALESRK
jgi:outer membrane murein-binding lipoprotein Lpp